MEIMKTAMNAGVNQYAQIRISNDGVPFAKGAIWPMFDITMDRTEKLQKCQEFFTTLSERLNATHTVVGSCNRDISAYLIPTGTDKEITYHSKPANSYRISDHWNWKSNLKKNPDATYIQCYSPDLPWCKQRFAPGKASPPILATSVCYFDGDVYKVIYGERYDRKTRSWEWVESKIDEVV